MLGFFRLLGVSTLLRFMRSDLRSDLFMFGMQHTLTLPAQTLPEFKNIRPTFNVLIAYENFETGKHAKGTYEFLQQHLGHDCHFAHTMWKFDVLALPKLWELALKDASVADIVIVSCKGNDLPGCVKSWIEAWLTGEHKALALIALFGEYKESRAYARGVREYLASAAARANLEFFAQSASWDDNSTQNAVGLSNTAELAHPQAALLAGVVHFDAGVPRWGINE